MANFKNLSRYTGAISTKNRSNKSFLILRNPLNLDKSDGDIFITVSKDLLYRPDLISSKAYGTPDLWWVIFEFNDLHDPILDLQVGQILRIPEINRVLEAINNLQV